LPLWDESKNHVFHLFVIRTANRLALQNYLKERYIEDQELDELNKEKLKIDS
jgi:hypothetical protein